MPLGGGVGEGSICGAVTGALIGMAYILTQNNVEKDLLIEACNKFKDQFTNAQESLRCRDILYEFNDGEEDIDRDHPKRREKCTNAIRTAMSLVVPIIRNHEELSEKN